MTAVVIWRGLLGDNPNDANASQADGPIPPHVDYVFVPTPTGFPWGDVQEDPDAMYSGIDYTNDVQIDVPDVGNQQIAGAWDGAYATKGPIVPWGYEVSGGLDGDQALGRTMRFQNMGPERYAANGVQEPSWADELAARLAYNGMGQVTEAEYTTSLLQSI